MMKYTDTYWKGVDESIGCIPDAEKLFGKRILITGATGMICSAIADLLLRMNRAKQAGIEVIAAGRSREKVQARFCGFTEADGLFYEYFDAAKAEEAKAAGSVDMIIHGASNANPAIYMKEPVETILANITGLDAMLQLALRKSASRVLYISSSEVYGQKEGMEPYREADYGFVDILSPRAGYPCSKRTGESLCVAYGMQHQLDTVIVRPGHIYGPTITDADNRASAEFTHKAVNGENITMNSPGLQLRSYCHTLDCASAILTVLLHGESASAYNISNPGSICTIRQIAQAFSDAAGTELITKMATEEEKKSYSPMSNSSLSSDRLEALGWKACFPLEKGVKQTVDVLKGI